MEVTIKVEGEALVKHDLRDLSERRIRMAMLKAVDRTADKTKARLYSEMHRVFDRPTPYTLNAIKIKHPSFNNPVAEVGFKESWAPRSVKYLTPEVEGGPRQHKGFERALSMFGVRGYGKRGIRNVLLNSEYLVPGRETPLDRYGGVSSGVIQKILSGLQSQPDEMANTTNESRKRKKSSEWYFFTTAGIWVRKGTRTSLLFGIAKRAPQYKVRFPFYALSRQFAGETYPTEFDVAIGEAIDKARQQS